MGGWIEVTDHGYLTDPRKNDGPILETHVTGWGVLASPTKSKKDWYHDEVNNPDLKGTRAQVNFHLFCKKTDTEGAPTVLIVKLFPDPQYNPIGLPVIAAATMAPTDHFEEWRIEGYFGKLGDSWVDLTPIPDDQIWYQSMPPSGAIDAPWRIIYNIFKYGWQP